MIEVFKTDVWQQAAALRLTKKLQKLFPGSRVNFDLDDCDRVLRVEGQSICCQKTIALLNSEGYQCITLV